MKKVTEPFLVDALSFTEAEARITEERTPYISGEFDVVAVKKSRIAEIVRDETGDKWYLGKVAIMTIDPKSGAEKKSVVQTLIQAKDFKTALENLMESYRTVSCDHEIVSIAETPIMDVYDVDLSGHKTRKED